MLLFALVLLATAVCLGGWGLARNWRGGSAAPPQLRLIGFPLAAVALQFVAVRLGPGAERFALVICSQALLLAFCLRNLRYPALRLLLLGFTLNLLPMLLNGGYMPITPDAVVAMTGRPELALASPGTVAHGSKDIVLPPAASPLWFLGDVFVVPYPFVLATAFSIGDVCILLGFGAAVLAFTSPRGNAHVSYRSGAPGSRRSAGPQVP